MSRTRKTRPLHVRMSDPTDQRAKAVPHHDIHGHEVCDLPASPAEQMKLQGGEHTKCYWAYTYTGHAVCCCNLCHGDGAYSSSPSKKARQEAKKIIREQLD